MLHDVHLLFVRHLRKSMRSPVWILVGLFEPILYLLLFMPLLKGLGSAPGLPAGGIERTFVPGLLVMLVPNQQRLTRISRCRAVGLIFC
jgi:ABC-2 type transport system permease protein